ncbi:MAG TPA: sigma-70 family RNA polymerase sigma factor [Cyclobacteriaceae bacterium]|nr:sigma-70 family RNA polymerase sigma factor [Cyclobacteriaceae bacterium]
MEPSVFDVWNEIQPGLKSFVYRQVKDRATTDDIIQEVFLKVHSRVNQLKNSEKISSWIYQIARNATTDYFRRKSKVLQSTDLDWESNGQEFNDCLGYCLSKLIVTLPVKYREALELTELNQLNQKDLAVRLQLSYAGARSRVQRARKMLKEKVNEHFRVETDAYGNVLSCENRKTSSCNPEGYDGEGQCY